ncbi:hypothetical protein BVX97_02990 [bacterium E08(2017)]|nr:hypothetical protein BVX97_02990 [bacterium E08(2017)]
MSSENGEKADNKNALGQIVSKWTKDEFAILYGNTPAPVFTPEYARKLLDIIAGRKQEEGNNEQDN